MVHIDWGGREPTGQARRYVEDRMAAWSHADGLRVSIAWRGSDFEGQLRASEKDDATMLRLRDDDVCRLVDRLLALLDVVASAPALAAGEER